MKTIVFCLTLLLSTSLSAQDPESPTLPGANLEPVSQEQIKPMVTICESCHGQGGQSTREDVPVIAGRPAEFIMNSLEQFYFVERHCPDVNFENKKGQVETKNMCDITNMLTKPEGLALAEYFSSQH